MEASKKRNRLQPRKQVQSKKIGLLIGSGANCKPSSDFTRRVESESVPHSGIFLHQISIGHAGDVIAYRSMQPFALDPPRRRIPKSARIEKVTFENLPQHLTRALVYLRHSRVVVNILIQKLPERAIGLRQIVTISNEDRLIPDIVSRLNFPRYDLLRAGHDHVPHLTINDVANDELV